MESQTKNAQTRSQIEAMAARAFSGLELSPDEAAVRELKDGWFNAAYLVQLADGREVVLKIAPSPGSDVMQYERHIMSTEVWAMRLVRQNPAIPVPEILFYDQTRELCDSDYFFMERVVGDNLEHVKASLPADTQATIGQQIGGIIREINGFSGAFFGYPGNADLRADTWRDAFLKMIDAILADAACKGMVFDFGEDELRTTILRHAPALEEVTTPCLVHWDAWNPNFFVREGRIVGIIDFERALWAEPLMEAQFRPLFETGVTHALQGYGKTTFTFPEQQRCHLYSLHLGLTMQTECAYRNYATDDILQLSRQFIRTTMAWLKSH
ncbi:phosphotransferase family protein [Deinococcus ruber]|uniref:Aminoglycoside phosphotransferase n=1 Tax=Deinococcus ruber TaxID=1848197 RepID=A0A918CH18_9DEIO|nr:aminoglycoside phosphotransferase family protein [Deinococcus ruber]GGR23363.1 aminoglycoside phosphotransferase [Deinococcus ruber]